MPDQIAQHAAIDDLRIVELHDVGRGGVFKGRVEQERSRQVQNGGHNQNKKGRIERNGNAVNDHADKSHDANRKQPPELNALDGIFAADFAHQNDCGGKAAHADKSTNIADLVAAAFAVKADGQRRADKANNHANDLRARQHFVFQKRRQNRDDQGNRENDGIVDRQRQMLQGHDGKRVYDDGAGGDGHLLAPAPRFKNRKVVLGKRGRGTIKNAGPAEQKHAQENGNARFGAKFKGRVGQDQNEIGGDGEKQRLRLRHIETRI